MNDTLYSSLYIGGAFVLGWVLYGITALVLKWREKGSDHPQPISLSGLKAPLRITLPALAVLFVLPLTKLPENITSAARHVLSIVILAAAGWLGIRAVALIRETVLRQYDIHAKDNLRARQIYTQIRMVEKIVRVIIVLLTVAVILMTFPKIKQFGVSILASAGIIGILIGFAAQKTLGNFIAGIQIALTQPIRLDDVVVVENEWGRIEEIALTYVVVRIWDQRRLILPISYFIEHPIQNWTRSSADILGTVYIYTDYTAPIDKIREELDRILEESGLWDRKVKGLQVTNMTERTVELRALMSAPDSSAAWSLRCEVREKLLAFLQADYSDSLPRTRVELNRTDG